MDLLFKNKEKLHKEDIAIDDTFLSTSLFVLYNRGLMLNRIK